MKKSILILCGCCVVLSGCSGSSTSNKNEELYTDNSTMSKVKNMFRSTKNITTKEVNVATLIASTFEVLPMPLQRFTAYDSAHDKNRDDIHTQIDILLSSDEFKKSLPDLKKNILARESGIKAIESGNPIIYARALKALNAAKNGNDDKFLWGFNLQNIVSGSIIGEANSGCNGWYSRLGDRNGMLAEMYAIAEVTYITNVIETKIADSMVDKTFYSEEDAKKYIINSFYSISSDDIYNIASNANETLSKVKFTADLTGVKGIQFTANNGSAFACTNEGILWSKSNDNWFGSGNLSGKKYITKVEYADGAEMAKTYKMELNNSTSTSNSNSADTSVKAK